MELMRLPAPLGGTSIDNPVADSRQKYAGADSVKCTVNLTQQFVESGDDLVGSIEWDYKEKGAVRQHHQASLKLKGDELQKHLPEAQECAMAQSREKGESRTLTTIAVAEYGFFFDFKADFHYHIHLRYCWPLDNMPSSCPCEELYIVENAQICKMSGFIHMRHDDTTDFLASSMKEVHNDVEV